LLDRPVRPKGKAGLKACLLYSLEAVANIVFEEGWRAVRKVKRLVVFVQYPVRRGKSPLEEEQRAMKSEEGALR
jgi:hypothetical protein